MDEINGLYFSGDTSEKSLKKAIVKAANGIEGAVRLLEVINDENSLTHTERKAMTKLVIMALKNVRTDAAQIANNTPIPF